MKDKKNKWKIKFYLNGQYVCSKKVDEDEQIFNQVYPVFIFGKRHFFRSLFVGTVIKPDKLLYKDEKRKVIHVGTVLFEGVDYEN